MLSLQNLNRATHPHDIIVLEISDAANNRDIPQANLRKKAED
jgi:hypothetical protein